MAAPPPVNDLKTRAALYTAIAALLALGLAGAVVAAAVHAGVDSDRWTKYVYLLGIPQAIGFAGAGWLWGKEVHREQAASAETRATKAVADATAATGEAAKQEQKVANLVSVIQGHADAEPDDVGGAVGVRGSKSTLKLLAGIAERIHST